MNKNGVITIAVIVIFLIAILGSCGGNNNKSDIAYDPDGFLGYSDSFWEWYAENN